MLSELADKVAAPFVTFYSFKGGVGRSMALINVAGILAGRGFRILVIDLDLEAPGLSYLGPRKTDATEQAPRGFVDFLTDAIERGPEADLFARRPLEAVELYVRRYELPPEIRKHPDGELYIMPAGRLDTGYQRRLDELDLRGLYSEGRGQPLVAAFKKVIQDAYCFDYVLIDSRTGFSDEAGICTRDLADHLVVVTGLNQQNIIGTADFLRALRQTADDKKSLQIVLSPIPQGEDELVDQREHMARQAFTAAWGQPIDLSLQIPYHPRLALTEEPHIFRRSRGSLYDAYVAIEKQLLTSLGLTVDSMLNAAVKAIAEQNYDETLKWLKLGIKLDNGRQMLTQMSVEMFYSTLKESGKPGLRNWIHDAMAHPLLAFLTKELPGFSWIWGSGIDC